MFGTSLALLALIGIGMICPMVGDEASAESLPGEGLQDSIVAQAAVDVSPVISIGLGASKLNIDLTPKSTGSSSETSTTLTVSTNNLNGYKIFLGSSNEGKLLNTDASIKATINPLSTPVNSPASFGNNTWGYAITKIGESVDSYNGVPGNATAVKNIEVASATNTDEYTLSFASKVDTTLPAGEYAGAIVVSAIANPITVTSLNQLFYMQDMTSEICTNTALDTTKQLIDTRDGKSYWVAKLADGNCWMTQNLALDITDAGLSASDTDIKEDWNSSSTYPPVETEKVVTNHDHVTVTNTFSWNLGTFVASAPQRRYNCTATDKVDTLQVCAQSGSIDVSEGYRPIFSAQMGSWTYNTDNNTIDATIDGAGNDTYIAVDTRAKTYDAHYLIGNYYQYNTAVAGHGDESSSNSSICPKGWTLPIIASNSVAGSYYNLLNAYGLANSSNSIAGEYAVTLPETSGSQTITRTISANQYNINKAPLHLVFGGYIGIDRLSEFYIQGHLWGISDSSLNFVFSDRPLPAVQSNRGFGFQVRCLAR